MTITLRICVIFSIIILLVGCSLVQPEAQKPANGSEAANSSLTRPPTIQANLPSATISAIDLSQLEPLSTEEQLQQVMIPARDVPDLSVRLRPDVQDVPLVVTQTVPNYAVGDLLEFWVHNPGSAENTRINAKLVYKTDVAYAWVEEGQNFDQAALVRSIDRFSTIIYPKESALFGTPWTPGVDNDPRLHILHTVKTGAGLAGYYSSVDEYSKLANPFSNEKEMFYINLNYLNAGQNYEAYEEVLAHELQHMIHWKQDRNEGVWMNEGLSEYAQDVAGYPQDLSFAQNFLSQPSTQLNDWGTVNSSNLIHYGAAYLFVRYMAQQYGNNFIHNVVTEQANGIDGIEAALHAYPAKPDRPTEFDPLFADWVVANYANAPDAPGAYGRWGYTDLALNKPPAQSIVAMSTPSLDESVTNYGTDYIEIAENLPFILDFAGITTTRLAPTTVYDGLKAAWSNRGDESDTRLTRQIDLTSIAAGQSVIMSAAMWWDIEEGYDFGYITVSRDGKKWQMLSGQRTTDQNISGNNFGVGYTGASGDWSVETFDLSPYAGQRIWLRFEVVSDDAVNRPGWLIDDVSIPAIGFFDGFEDGTTGWQSEGWIVTNNQLTQRWLVQVLEYEDNKLVDVKRPTIENGQSQFTIRNLRNGRNVLAISGLTRNTTESATYQVSFTPSYE
ncbi:MAG: immune inhibitor A [Caldilineaceae bacterium]